MSRYYHRGPEPAHIWGFIIGCIALGVVIKTALWG